MSDDVELHRGSEERTEIERHDRLYAERMAGKELRLDEHAWARFENPRRWHPYDNFVLAMGDLRDRRVLDVGCGDGWLSVILAKRGGLVSGFDISPEAARIATRRAEVNGVANRCDFRAASAYEMPYEDATFDVVVGMSLIHHLGEKDRLAAEVRRVLKPGGHAVFLEPFAETAWLQTVRKLVPVRSLADDDPDQRPLRYADLAPFQARFAVEAREYQVLSRLERILFKPGFRRAVGLLDEWMLRHLPFTRPLARHVLVTLRQKR